MPKIIRISAEFIRENKYLMANLTPQQQKIWFVPYLAVYHLHDEAIYRRKQVSVSLDEIRIFLNSKQINKELGRTLKKAFHLFEELYLEKYKAPFKFVGIRRGYAIFEVNNIFVFSQFTSFGKQYYMFDLEEIALYGSAKHYTSRALPLLWYCISHKHWNKTTECWEINLGDRQLKEIFGMGRYDYLYVPNGLREFYIEVDSHFQGYALKGWDNRLKLVEKYGMKDAKSLEDYYLDLRKKVTFKRWDFEQKVLWPAIKELNEGHMIKFLRQDVLKRTQRGQKAKHGKSYIRKNYEFYKEGFAVTSNGSYVYKNITDFTKLQKGNQYSLQFEVRNLSDVLEQPKAPLAEDVLFEEYDVSDGVANVSEEEPYYDEFFSEEEIAYYYNYFKELMESELYFDNCS